MIGATRTTHGLVLIVFFALVTGACGGAGRADPSAAGEDPSAGNREPEWPTELVFAAVPEENSASLEADFGTTLAILADELGLEKIEFLQASDYAGVLEALIAERVDVAQLGGFPYIIAESNGADLSVAGVPSEGPDIAPGYRSYGITRPGSGIESLADFAGKAICFIDPGSTSGYLFPSAALIAEGIDPSVGSSDIVPVFVGSHDASVIAVMNGDCDAGFAYDEMVTVQLVEDGTVAGVLDSVEGDHVDPDDASIEIVWKSEVIAGQPLVISNALPRSFVEAFIEVLTTKVNVDWATANGYCDPGQCEIANHELTWGFVRRDSSFYDAIRDVCARVETADCR